jgi:hypothetical protein
MHVVALVWGILSLCGMFIGFVPCLGALNWINIPFSAVGLLVSIIAHGKAPLDKKGQAMAGIVMNGIAVVLGGIRLVAGAGVV